VAGVMPEPDFPGRNQNLRAIILPYKWITYTGNSILERRQKQSQPGRSRNGPAIVTAQAGKNGITCCRRSQSRAYGAERNDVRIDGYYKKDAGVWSITTTESP
jgi:hypothetical protein